MLFKLKIFSFHFFFNFNVIFIKLILLYIATFISKSKNELNNNFFNFVRYIE
jgi:hypothetical protein